LIPVRTRRVRTSLDVRQACCPGIRGATSRNHSSKTFGKRSRIGRHVGLVDPLVERLVVRDPAEVERVSLEQVGQVDEDRQDAAREGHCRTGSDPRMRTTARQQSRGSPVAHCQICAAELVVRKSNQDQPDPSSARR
jgi:hypothetical protein